MPSQVISDQDVEAVVKVLRSDWLTTGPEVQKFERAFAKHVGAAEAVAVSSGTAALDAAMFALGIGPGDELIVPAMTFAATANCVVYHGATPIFADVDPDTLLIGPKQVEAKLSPRTKAIIAVDYAGQPCNYQTLGKFAYQQKVALVADASHFLGGAHADDGVHVYRPWLSIFSFHPSKAITTGEGGMVTTNRTDLAERMRRFRNHGFNKDCRLLAHQGDWRYEMIDLGRNYRMTDFQAALGLSQLSRLPEFIKRRQQIADRYDRAFACIPGIEPLGVRPGVSHARHLYVVRMDWNVSGITREDMFREMRAAGIQVGVHYLPVHLHPYYQQNYGTKPGDCPVAERAYEEILSLPIAPTMTDRDVDDVVEKLAWQRIDLRPVAPEDVLAIWRLANDSHMREMSFSNPSIPFEQHIAWYQARFTDSNTRMWVLDCHGEIIAMVRYVATTLCDAPTYTQATIHFAVAAGHTGRGLGARLIRNTLAPAFRALGVDSIIAKVKDENTASMRTLQNAGFVETSTSSDYREFRFCHKDKSCTPSQSTATR